MRKLLPLLALAISSLAVAHAAISVLPGGSGLITFGTQPPADQWSTRSLAGSELTFTTAGTLAAAVQTNGAAALTNTVLDGLGAVPPGQNTLASWSGGGPAALWTRPAANGATLLMATLQNNTGLDQGMARISYTLGQSGTTPAEQIPAHQVYYSLSGAPATWVNIPALSGGGPGPRSEIVVLNGTWIQGALLHILWVDDNTTGGVDRGYSLDDAIFTGRPPPTLEVIPDVLAEVLQPIFFHALGSQIVPGARLVYSLDPGAPPTASINPTNGLFIWKPSRADAASTNSITIRTTDVDAPGLSAAQMFTVVVRDYVELSLPSVVMEGGQRTNVVLECATTAPLTNLQITVRLPSERITNAVFDNLAPSAVSMTLDGATPGIAVLTLAALPGQWLAGTQALVRLHFTAAPEPSSAFVPLPLDEVIAGRAQPGLAPSVLLNPGRAVIVNREPLVEASVMSTSRTLTLYGRPGTNYTVETAPSVSGLWQPRTPVTLSALFETFDISDGTNAPAIFYRAREGAGAPSTVAPQQLRTLQPAAQPKKLKKVRKKKLPATRPPNSGTIVLPGQVP